MTTASILFILLVSAFYGCLFHLITGGNVFSIFVDIVIALLGFIGGHYFGILIDKEFIRLGVINFGWGSAGSFIFLVIGGMISHPLF